MRPLTRNTTRGGLALDLTEVTVVSIEAVKALTVAEANGIELRNCPAYVREWISRWRECGRASENQSNLETKEFE